MCPRREDKTINTNHNFNLLPSIRRQAFQVNSYDNQGFWLKRTSLSGAKLARTRRGKVARMRRDTLHSTIKAKMNEVRSDVMFCSITEILSAMVDFASAAFVARRPTTRLELCSSSSNHPTSFLNITGKKIHYNQE